MNAWRMARSRGARRHGEEGFTIVELMMALAVFAVVIGAVATTMSGALGTTRLNRSRSIAAHVAAREMDAVRSAGTANLAVGQTQSSQVVEGVTYTIQRHVAWVVGDAILGACEGPEGGQSAFLRVLVAVTWPNMGGTDPVTSQTILAPPVGSDDPYSGNLSVTVLTAAAAPVQGHVVSVSGPSLTSGTTGPEGCVFFPYLPQGSYTVTISTPGYVDGQGSSPANQTVGVNPGETTSVQFDYDQAASLNLTLAGTAGGSVPSNVPVTVANTNIVPTGIKIVPGTGSSRTVGNLFPYASGYEAWAGGCADADPASFSGGARQPPLTTSPGGSSSGTVNMATVNVWVRRFGFIDQANVTVTAHHNSDSVCGSGMVLTLGQTNSSGMLTAALPYGSWRFQVTGKSPFGSWPTQVLSPTSSSVPTVQVNVF